MSMMRSNESWPPASVAARSRPRTSSVTMYATPASSPCSRKRTPAAYRRLRARPRHRIRGSERSRGASRDAVLAQLLVEGRARDAKRACSRRLVALMRLERGGDALAFEPDDRIRECARCRAIGVCAHLRRKIVGLDDSAVEQHEQPLDRVAQLSHVARPCVTLPQQLRFG